jgi:hypothetical protein
MGMTIDELTFKPRLQVVNDAQIAQIHMATPWMCSSARASKLHTRKP